MIDTQRIAQINVLVERISVKLIESGHKIFTVKPTAYIYPLKDKYLISLVNEKRSDIEVIELKQTDRPKNGLVNFFISLCFLDDDCLSAFAQNKVDIYLEELREEVAYSTNLKRAKSLSESGHYLASIVFLVSAFETAMKDIFFRNNDLWFIWPESLPKEVYDKYGKRLPPDHPLTFDGEYDHFTSIGNITWGLSKEGDACIKSWQKIRNGNVVFKTCEQLGILKEYLFSLYSNNLEEIRSYEILKDTLKNKGVRSAINFQIIDGPGGITWSFKQFMGLEFNEVNKDLAVIREAATKRHKIIHGYLDEKEITSDYVKEVETAVIKIIEYVKSYTFEWTYLFYENMSPK